MASREERLIGFQVIEKVNYGNDMVYDSSCHLKFEKPVTGEPLTVLRGNGDGLLTRPELATVSDVRDFTDNNAKVVSVEVEERLVNFVKYFNDDRVVDRGLKHFNTERQWVDRDVEEVLIHTPNVKVATTLLDDCAGFKENGNLLGLYNETVDLYVHAELHIDLYDGMLNTVQDVFNAIALELRGLCSYGGWLRYPEFQDRIQLIHSRLRVLSTLKERAPDTVESRGWFKVWRYLDRNIRDAKTVDDLSLLGEYVDRKIAQLPLLRRWWRLCQDLG